MAHEKDQNPQENLEEIESSIVELTDEEGNVVAFEYLSTIEHKGQQFVILMAPQEEDEEDEDEGEVVILKIQQDDKGEDTYVSLEDEDLEQEVFDLFMEELDNEDYEEMAQGEE